MCRLLNYSLYSALCWLVCYISGGVGIVVCGTVVCLRVLGVPRAVICGGVVADLCIRWVDCVDVCLEVLEMSVHVDVLTSGDVIFCVCLGVEVCVGVFLWVFVFECSCKPHSITCVSFW